MRLVAVVLWLAVVAGATGAVFHVQDSARRDLEERFAFQATEGARFAEHYVSDVFHQQHEQAVALLSGTAPSEEQFELATLSLGYPAAVLLDDRGQVLNVTPADPAMIGRSLTPTYEHLRRAVAGSDAISAVVPSAVTGLPIVAFAVPFDTPTGRRVFCGGFEASDTPLAAYLKEGMGVHPGKAYLVDADSGVVATSADSVVPGQTLRSQELDLADAFGRRPAGLVGAGAKSSYFTSAPVAGTSWHLLASMPTAELYAPISGSRLTIAWLLVAAVAAGGLAIVVFVVRLSDAARTRSATLALLEANASELAAARDEALAGSQRLLEAQGLVHLGSWEWDIVTDAFTSSPELCRIFGLQPDAAEPSGEGLFARLHPDDQTMVEDAVGRSLQTQERLQFTARIVTDEGEVRWIDAQAEVATAADGTPLKMAGTVLDVTDRARAREELEALALRFTSGFQHSPIGIALASPDGRYLKVNPALCQMLGRDEATLLTMRLQDLTHPDDLGIDEAQLQAMTTGESAPWQAEKRCLLPDGSVMWAQLNSLMVPDGAGAPSYLFTQFQDVTKTKALADAVVRDREFLAAVLHNLSDGVVACNADGVLTLFNRATQEFHGLPVTAVAAKDWVSTYSLYRADGITPMELEEIPLMRALQGQKVHDAEMVIVPDQASRRIVRVSAQAIRDSGGNLLGAVAAMHDVTQQKKAEDELASLNADLERRGHERTAVAERANEAKSEFLSRMSHELRTPLNAMLGFAQLLGMDELHSHQTESVEHIMSGGRHLLVLINDMLDLARIESGSLAMSIDPTALGAVLDEALHLLRPQAALAGVSLPARAPAGAAVHVLADHHRLRQIVLNLLSNAVKYNSDAGTVSVACERRDSGHLRFSVTDSGPGIPAEETQRVFMPFERLAATATAVEGTGLGLAICKRLADAMGIAIGFASVLGQGSTFWLDLSVAEEEMSPETTAAPELELRPGADEATVLYIEDNASNVQLVGAVLGRLPHIRLLTAGSGHMGLELAQAQRPDLVLLDLGLPDISGAEVMKRLRADATTATIPVVVLSADATDAQMGRLLAGGAASYLTKPLEVGLFLTTVQEALRANAEQHLFQQARTSLELAAPAATTAAAAANRLTPNGA